MTPPDDEEEGRSAPPILGWPNARRVFLPPRSKRAKGFSGKGSKDNWNTPASLADLLASLRRLQSSVRLWNQEAGAAAILNSSSITLRKGDVDGTIVLY